MCGIREREEIGVREGVDTRDAFTWLISQAAREEIERVGAGGGEEVAQNGFGELTNSDIVRKFGVALDMIKLDVSVREGGENRCLQAIRPLWGFPEPERSS